MKKWIFPLLLAIPVVYFVACSKSTSNPAASCTDVAVNSDSSKLIAFASDSISLTRDTTGLYYQIIDSGTGGVPVPTSYLQVSYRGTLMNHTVFDSATKATLQVPLYQLIPGWQIGLPKIKEGGHIKLLIPSHYAYGCQGASNGSTVIIPANEPVYFDIYLISTGI